MADSKDSGESVVLLPLLVQRMNLTRNLQDYTLTNPDTLTKLKTAAEISQKVLAKVKEACTPGANLLEICQKGDALLEEETGKVYKGKKIAKGEA
jgi:methionine aminopeptidase